MIASPAYAPSTFACGFQTRKVTDSILIMYENVRKRLVLAAKFGVSSYLSSALKIVMQAGEAREPLVLTYLLVYAKDCSANETSLPDIICLLACSTALEIAVQLRWWRSSSHLK